MVAPIYDSRADGNGVVPELHFLKIFHNIAVVLSCYHRVHVLYGLDYCLGDFEVDGESDDLLDLGTEWDGEFPLDGEFFRSDLE
jgi:hypothetical protein